MRKTIKYAACDYPPALSHEITHSPANNSELAYSRTHVLASSQTCKLTNSRTHHQKEEAIPDINKLEEEDLDISICGIKIPIKVGAVHAWGECLGEGLGRE